MAWAIARLAVWDRQDDAWSKFALMLSDLVAHRIPDKHDLDPTNWWYLMQFITDPWGPRAPQMVLLAVHRTAIAMELDAARNGITLDVDILLGQMADIVRERFPEPPPIILLSQLTVEEQTK